MRFPLAVLLCFALPAAATTYQIGPTRDLKSLKPLAPQLKAGDIVEVDSGTYREVLKLQNNGTREAPILIRGVGEARPIFDAEGLDTSGRGPIPRGVLQIEGAYIVVEHMEFRNARNGDNAAGIRVLDSTNAIIRDCKVTQCDMGIFGNDKETVTIEKCEIAFNGTDKFNGYSHNFYMHGNRVVVRGCYIHDALFGQNFKSRAHYNELWFNWISDSNEGEVGFVDAKDVTSKPHSNALMVGNIVVSKTGRTGNTLKFVDFGADGGNAHDGTLFLFHNTLVAGEGKIKFVMVSGAPANIVAANNIFVGSNQLTMLLKTPVKSENISNFSGPDPEFTNAAGRDFRPRKAAGVARGAAPNLTYEDGDGVKHTLKIEEQYAPHLKLKPRASSEALGALEAAGE